jgi:hypothetical protein
MNGAVEEAGVEVTAAVVAAAPMTKMV